MPKKKKNTPKLKSEKAAFDFWSKEDSTDHVDWSKAERASFPNLKPSTKTISLRLPEAMLEDLKKIANKMDIPYQSLMKMMLSDAINKENNKHN